MNRYTDQQLRIARAAAHQRVRMEASHQGAVATVELACMAVTGTVDGLKELCPPEAIADFLYTMADSMALACATKAVPEAFEGKKLDGGR